MRLAMLLDVWEYAFILHYKPSERVKYIDAFFSNIDWAVIAERLRAGAWTYAGAAQRRGSLRVLRTQDKKSNGTSDDM